jgi:hypothetical protein
VSFKIVPVVKTVFEVESLKKNCSVEEFMTIENPNEICNNPTLVKGSCAEPEFFKNIHTINLNNEKILEFLDLIIKSNITNKDINITLGSRDDSSNIKLYIS